ncbi:hypothetical protein [Paenibacillus donghaensis]|uniref:Aminoglycoside phosphotransferase domain-containing protein n=1 Tax=Paenibacillus donghaensis TaxID=414771 RepID=A0A2Z2KEZ7_9BACL|nr:hypothetical protein [Paenibacillus donghaensis]ASA22515.1 hypothetical protein B9T62_18035 [Paenibacillus donghaensis]
MTAVHDIPATINALCTMGIIETNTDAGDELSGTTDGVVCLLKVEDEPKYVLKYDDPRSIAAVQSLHKAYQNSQLLPKLYYTAPDQSFMLYAYVPGTTHTNRGPKKDWLALLVKELLNHYAIDPHAEHWGRVELPARHWRDFNEESLRYARMDVKGILPDEDYEVVRAIMDPISQADGRYLLHGDAGVHNFVYRESTLAGVIDPSPMFGPVTYDFTYAFCSSPDDLNVETLFAAYELLSFQPITRTQLIYEVLLQLYCRIGICSRFHPHELEEYLQAWAYWKAQVSL